MQSTNPDCTRFKNPTAIAGIVKEDPTKKGTCANDFAKMLGECYYDCKEGDKRVECTLLKTGAAWIGYKTSVEEAQKDHPSFVYQPEYDFVEYPKQCDSTCNRFTCTNGFCVPDIHGAYTEPTCGGQCQQPTPPPTKAPRRPQTTPRVVREGYEIPTTVPGEDCVNKFKASSCHRGANPYQNVSNYFVNAQNERLFASSGWVGLPDVFVKYSYNNYFVRLNNSDQVASSTLRNLYYEMNSLIQSVSIANDANPSNPFGVAAQNDGVNIAEYATYLAKAQASAEMYKPPPIPTARVRGEDLCPDYLDRKTYLQIGTQYPKTNYPKFDTSTVQSGSPGCSYYADYCACEHNGKKNAPPCNLLQRGFTDCKGNPCFTKWGLQTKTSVVFEGEAKCFSISGNTGETIIFPNPDAQYIACATVYDPEAVYVVWMDVPTTPMTPGYANLLNENHDMRYWSLGHYYWAMGILNQRPALSGIMDQGFKTVDVKYTDDKYENCLQSKRVCVVVATADQHEYLGTYQLMDDRVNWLNWGKLDGLNLQTPPESPPPYPESEMMEGYSDIRQGNRLSKFASAAQDAEAVGVNLDLDLKGFIKKVVPKKVPMEGMLILRQLRANESFQESIASYVKSKPACLTKTIALDQSKAEAAAYPPTLISQSCNPGNQAYCDKYGLSPCCLATDPLYHMRQYYPRCEKVKICDIENAGSGFWEKYLTEPLPYLFDAGTPCCAPTCPPAPTTK